MFNKFKLATILKLHAFVAGRINARLEAIKVEKQARLDKMNKRIETMNKVHVMLEEAIQEHSLKVISETGKSLIQSDRDAAQLLQLKK